jgi:hypothetical protein
MPKKSRATFQKREKERARQHKQHDKAQRRLAVKAQRASTAPAGEDEAGAGADMSQGPHTLPAREQEAHAADERHDQLVVF